MPRLSSPDSRHHRRDTEDVERPPQIIDERGQTELGADIVEALHQKGALVHPLLDRAEGMLDHLAPPVENFRSRFQSHRHAVEHRLVFQTRDLAIALGAARLDRANETRRPIAVIDLRQFPRLAFIARRQDLAGRTDECVALRVVASGTVSSSSKPRNRMNERRSRSWYSA